MELFWSVMDYQVWGSSTVGTCLCIALVLRFVWALATQKETHEEIVERELYIMNRRK